MKNLYILTVVMTVFSISLFAQQPPVSEFLEKVPLGLDNPPDTLPEFLVTFDGGDPGPEPVEGYRMVYWVHGLNGNASSLSKPGEASEGLEFQVISGFPARKVYSAYPDYSNAQTNLDGARLKLRSELQLDDRLPINHNRRNDFIISHSQGGIVSRALDRHYSFPENQAIKKFGGIITLATSNQGAQIINNQDHVQGVLEDMVKSLAIGPAKELAGALTPSFLPFLYKFIGDTVLMFQIFDIVAVNLTDYSLNQSLPGITSQYAVGANEINLLNSYTPDGTNLVAFYAIREDLSMSNGVTYSIPVPSQVHFPNGFNLTAKLQDWGLNIVGGNIYVTLAELPVPISWATLEYFIKDPATDFEYFKTNAREHELALDAHKTQFRYQAKRMAYNATQGEYHARVNNAILNPLASPGKVMRLTLKQEMHKDIRNAYRQGAEFFNRFDDSYRAFIGARVSQAVQVPTYNPQCQCFISSSFSNDTIVYNIHDSIIPAGYDCSTLPNANVLSLYIPAHLVAEGVTCHADFVYDTVIEWINKPSDGVVLAESAMNIPQATFDPQEVKGSTHMAIRNDDNLKIELNKIFEGDVGLFFKTEKK